MRVVKTGEIVELPERAGWGDEWCMEHGRIGYTQCVCALPAQHAGPHIAYHCMPAAFWSDDDDEANRVEPVQS